MKVIHTRLTTDLLEGEIIVKHFVFDMVNLRLSVTFNFATCSIGLDECALVERDRLFQLILSSHTLHLRKTRYHDSQEGLGAIDQNEVLTFKVDQDEVFTFKVKNGQAELKSDYGEKYIYLVFDVLSHQSVEPENNKVDGSVLIEEARTVCEQNISKIDQEQETHFFVVQTVSSMGINGVRSMIVESTSSERARLIAADRAGKEWQNEEAVTIMRLELSRREQVVMERIIFDRT